MKGCILRVIFGGLAFVVAVILGLGLVAPLLRGWLLHHTLLAATDGASTIKVIEHSDSHDLPFDPEEKYEEKIFRSLTLSADQISQLRRALSASLDYSLTVATACIFVPHHRVEITRKDDGVTVLEICFQCGEIRLDGGESRIMPKGWKSSLQSFVISLGMSPTPKEANNAQRGLSPSR